VLNDLEASPFEVGYEGAADDDIVGRLDDWPWPEE
jgi:hypothetical protein